MKKDYFGNSRKFKNKEKILYSNKVWVVNGLFYGVFDSVHCNKPWCTKNPYRYSCSRVSSDGVTTTHIILKEGETTKIPKK